MLGHLMARERSIINLKKLYVYILAITKHGKSIQNDTLHPILSHLDTDQDGIHIGNK